MCLRACQHSGVAGIAAPPGGCLRQYGAAEGAEGLWPGVWAKIGGAGGTQRRRGPRHRLSATHRELAALSVCMHVQFAAVTVVHMCRRVHDTLPPTKNPLLIVVCAVVLWFACVCVCVYRPSPLPDIMQNADGVHVDLYIPRKWYVGRSLP